MRIIYWGAYNTGKAHVRMLHRASNKKSLSFNTSGHFAYVLRYEKNVEYEDFYQKLDKIECISRVKNTMPSTRLCYDYGEQYNYVDDRPPLKRSFQQRIKGLSTMFNDMQWDYLLDEWEDCEFVMTPYPIIGIPNQSECNRGRRIEPSDKCIEFIKNSVNIVPYKENHLDSIISKLACFDKGLAARRSFKITGKFVVFKDLVDAFVKHREMVWLHLDDIMNEGYNIEKRLRQYNIEYQYFNLDKDDYDIFDCQVNLPRTYTHPDWDLSNEKTYDNWSQLRHIAEEYISDRNLQDARLDAKITS